MRAIVAGAGLSRRQLPVDRARIPVDAAAHQRLQPARHQCARRQHLEQLLLESYKDAALGRHGHAAATRSRRGRSYAMPGGGRGYTRVAVADQPSGRRRRILLNNTRRAVLPLSLGRGADEGVRRLDRADAVAGDPRARCGAGRQARRQDRPHRRAQLHLHPELLCPKVREHAGPIARRIIDKQLDDGGFLQIGPIPKGTPVNLLSNLQPLAESNSPGSR